MTRRKRFSDRVDELADRLQDAAETFRGRRADLLRQLEEAKNAYATELLAAEDWAIEEGLIQDENWVDKSGETFLPWTRTEVIAEEVPDLGTLLRERVETLIEQGVFDR